MGFVANDIISNKRTSQKISTEKIVVFLNFIELIFAHGLNESIWNVIHTQTHTHTTHHLLTVQNIDGPHVTD